MYEAASSFVPSGPLGSVNGPDHGIHPGESQPDNYYTRSGEGDLGADGINDPLAEIRRTDFIGDRDHLHRDNTVGALHAFLPQPRPTSQDLPEAAGPLSSNNLLSFAARETTWIITGSMK